MKKPKTDFSQQCKKCGSKDIAVDADFIRLSGNGQPDHFVFYVSARCNEWECMTYHYSYSGQLPGDDAAYFVRLHAFGKHEMDWARKPHKWCDARYQSVQSRLMIEENGEMELRTALTH